MNPDRLRQVASVLEMAQELDSETRSQYLTTLESQDSELVAHVRFFLSPDGSPESSSDPTEVALPPSQATVPPSHVGPYRVKEWLGAGGMGTVYAGERDDDEFRRRVAIKILRVPFPSQELVSRFRSERQILAAFDHPNIAKLFDGATTRDGLPYLVMELIEGMPMPAHCDEQGYSVRRRVELVRKVCSAVQYAHSRLVVHRDLKPSNIMVTAQGEPKLLDFGIAKLLDPDAFPLTVQATVTGQGPFTPHFASPEQLRGEVVTTASDVYSLGVNLYLLLAGVLPFRPENPSPAGFLRLMATVTPTLVSRVIRNNSRLDPSTGSRFGVEPEVVRRQLRGDLDNIVAKALETDPARRYRSVEQLDDDLRCYLEGLPVSAREGTWLYRAGKLVRRHKVETGALAGFLGLSAAFTAVTASQAQRIAEEKEAADRQRERAEAAQSSAERALVKAEASAEAEKQVSQLLIDIFASDDPEQLQSKGSKVDLVRSTAERVTVQEGLEHRTRVRLMSILGLLLRNFSAREQAVEMMEKVAALTEGEETPERLEVLVNLGRAYIHTKKLEPAGAALDEAYALANKVDRTVVAKIANLQGIVCFLSGKKRRSIDLCRQAQRLAVEEFGPDSRESLLPLVNSILFEADIHPNAKSTEELFRLCGYWQQKPGLTRPLVLRTLSAVLIRSKHFSQWKRAQRFCLHSELEVYGFNNLVFLNTYLCGIRCLVDWQDFGCAKQLLDALPFESLAGDVKDQATDDYRITLGYFHWGLEEYSEAVELFGLGDSVNNLDLSQGTECYALALRAWAALEIGQPAIADDALQRMESHQDRSGNTGTLELFLRGRMLESTASIDQAIASYRRGWLNAPLILEGDMLWQTVAERLERLLMAQNCRLEARQISVRRKAKLRPRYHVNFPDWLSNAPPWPTREQMLASVNRS